MLSSYNNKKTARLVCNRPFLIEVHSEENTPMFNPLIYIANTFEAIMKRARKRIMVFESSATQCFFVVVNLGEDKIK